jgi:hypothetical protein
LACLSCVKSAADGTKTELVALVRCRQRFVTDAWTVALLVSTALHAGFQLTVTFVVYPGLADVQPDLWAVAHARHSRRITPLVALVYGAALACCVGVLINSGGNTTTQLAGMVIAIAGTVAAIALTAFCAGPTHRRLGSGLNPVLIGRLLTCDRWRTVAAVLALVGAVVLATG